MELTLKEIELQLDVPLKSYGLFVFGKLRVGVWEDLFKTHLDKHYPSNPETEPLILNKENVITRGGFYSLQSGEFKGVYRSLLDTTIPKTATWSKSKRGDLLIDDKLILKEVTAIRNSKRTNLPRTIWQKDELSWLSYYEGVLILSQVYKSVTIDFELAYKGREIHSYKVPVSWELFEIPDGVNIKHRGRVDNALVVDPSLDRTYEQGLTYVVREVMRRHKLTRLQLDKLLDTYASEPDNLYSFTTDSQPNIKSSILGTMFKWNITWGNFTRALKVLGYTDLSMSIHAIRRSKGKDEDVITTVNMGLL